MGSRTIFLCIVVVFFVSSVAGTPRVRRQAGNPTSTALNNAVTCIQNALKNLTQLPNSNLTSAQNQSINNLVTQLPNVLTGPQLQQLLTNNPLLGTLQCALNPQALLSILEGLQGQANEAVQNLIKPVTGILTGLVGAFVGVVGGLGTAVGTGATVLTGITTGLLGTFTSLLSTLTGLFSSFGNLGGGLG